MSFEPKIFESDEDPRRAESPERRALGEPPAPLWNDADELELPADLAMLAEQLRDDALHLAACHPADASPEHRAAAWLEVQKSAAPPSRFARFRWWATGAAAAAVFMGAGWWGWLLNQPQVERPAEVAVVSTPDMNELRTSGVVAARNQGADASHSPSDEMNVIAGSEEVNGPRVIRLPEDSPPRVIPAGAFLQDVSGPELDAMLELLAEQTDTGLSI